MAQLVRKYEGHDIFLNDDYSFEVTLDKEVEKFSTMNGVTTAIDRHNALVARQNRVKFSAVMLDDWGQRVNIRGIDGRNSSLLGVDADKISKVYPDVTWISHSFQERQDLYKRIKEIETEQERQTQDLRTQIDAINADLEKVEMKTKWGFGRMSPEEYEKQVANIERRYKIALMNAMEKQAVIEKTKTVILGPKKDDE